MDYKKYFQITSVDKKNLEKYAESIDCVVINANIAVYNKKFINRCVQNYNLDLIIDPMTYILQTDIKKLLSKKNNDIKPSLKSVLQEIYDIDVDNLSFKSGAILWDYLQKNIGFFEFLKKVYDFQNNFIIENDLGVFSNVDKKLKMISSPYFDVTNKKYLDLNKKIINNDKYVFDIFRIIVSKNTNWDFLVNLIDFINKKSKLNLLIEIWIDGDRKSEFNSFVQIFKRLERKILFKFISFEEIALIRENIPILNVEGFITPFGYGESRTIYPVGGGLPRNKVYSLQKRTRIQVTDYLNEMMKNGIKKSNSNAERKYLKIMCNCSICKELIKKNSISGINLFAEYSEYRVKLKNGKTSGRIMATQKAKTLTDYHYIENKIKEYDDFYSNDGFSSHWYDEYFKR